MTNFIPDWVQDAIFYQIFPDRFALSDTLDKPANLQPWGSSPTSSHYQGGDLVGIVERLDYLTDLGISALYLNPVFQSATNHRYHTHDYFRVDPLLGGDKALRSLVEQAHARGIRIILDGVFNHASRGFFQFNDILENGKASPWLDWFTIKDWPLSPYNHEKPANYESWWNLRQLPKFNTNNPQVREFLLQVAEYWIKEFDIDGWRLDVPGEISTLGFWEEFRHRVKLANSEAYLVGEIWEEAGEWLQGDRFDGVMNYRFAEAIISFVAGDQVSPILVESQAFKPYPSISAEEFGNRIRRLHDFYGWEATLGQLNLVDSHDTPRLGSLVRGDRAAIELALLILMTSPGAPCIYYGDEVGIRGSNELDQRFRDAEARWAFPWHDLSSWDRQLLEYFKSAIKVRQRYPVLRRGEFKQLYSRDSCYVFLRLDHTDALLVAVNAGSITIDARLEIGDYLEDGSTLNPVFGPGLPLQVSKGSVVLSVPARSGIVLARS
jgi:glycosidase